LKVHERFQLNCLVSESLNWRFCQSGKDHILSELSKLYPLDSIHLKQLLHSLSVLLHLRSVGFFFKINFGQELIFINFLLGNIVIGEAFNYLDGCLEISEDPIRF
jgi:hypothetical protein